MSVDSRATSRLREIKSSARAASASSAEYASDDQGPETTPLPSPIRPAPDACEHLSATRATAGSWRPRQRVAPYAASAAPAMRCRSRNHAPCACARVLLRRVHARDYRNRGLLRRGPLSHRCRRTRSRAAQASISASLGASERATSDPSSERSGWDVIATVPPAQFNATG